LAALAISCSAPKPPDDLVVASEVRVQDLERDVASDEQILRFIDGAHRPLPDDAQKDELAADHHAWVQRRVSRRHGMAQ